jgi:hypothetical protein
MKKVGCSECMYQGTFYRKKPGEWNDVDTEFVKEFNRRL